MQAVKVLGILKKEYLNTKYYLDFKSPFQLLVAAILSPQVRDEIVNETTPKLFKKYPDAKSFADASPSAISDDIKHISLHNNKAKSIHEACKILIEKYGGKVPKTMAELKSLPGIGEKTANAILQNAFDIVVGIPCDTHVLRVSYRLGWTKNKDANKVEQDLEKLFPKSDWKTLPHIMKAHGRAICRTPPKCSQCCVEKYCPKVGVKKSV